MNDNHATFLIEKFLKVYEAVSREVFDEQPMVSFWEQLVEDSGAANEVRYHLEQKAGEDGVLDCFDDLASEVYDLFHDRFRYGMRREIAEMLVDYPQIVPAGVMKALVSHVESLDPDQLNKVKWEFCDTLPATAAVELLPYLNHAGPVDQELLGAIARKAAAAAIAKSEEVQS